MRKKVDTRDPDQLIARIAARQHGVVSLRQIRYAGLSSAAVSRRVGVGRLFRIHRGVYAVGHRGLSQPGIWMAAVLACGANAVLSHGSAAQLWEIHRRNRRREDAKGHGEDDQVDVTVRGRVGRRKREGIALHRSPTLVESDCTRRNGIPVTTPARTLQDLRRVVSPMEYAAVVRQAEFLRLPIGDHRSDRPHTELEARMLALCRRHRLAQPEVNVRVDRFVVDFLWRGQRLIIEVDGWESHRTRSAFERDRARDARLKLLGYEVLRFTWRQLSEDGARSAGTIRRLLRVRSPQARLGD